MFIAALFTIVKIRGFIERTDAEAETPILWPPHVEILPFATT